MHCHVCVLPGSIENRYYDFVYTFTVKVLEIFGAIQHLWILDNCYIVIQRRRIITFQLLL